MVAGGEGSIVAEDLWWIRQRAQPTAMAAIVVVAFKRCEACNNTDNNIL